VRIWSICAAALLAACHSNGAEGPSTATSEVDETARRPEPSATAGSTAARDPGTTPAPKQGSRGGIEYPKLAPIDPQLLKRAEKGFAQIDAIADRDTRARAVAAFISELEEGRLHPKAVEALGAAGAISVDLHQRRTILYTAVTQTPELLAAWNHACDTGRFRGGGWVLANFSSKSIDARDKVVAIYGLCRLAQRGLVPKPAELSEDHGLLVLAHTAHAYLEQRGGMAELERRALVLLAKGGKPLAKPITRAELPPVDDTPALEGEALKTLRKRIDEGIALLESGDGVKFIESFIHPDERARLAKKGGVSAVAKQLVESGRAKAVLKAFRWAREHDAIAARKGSEARYILPWSPAREAMDELRFVRSKGVWYLKM